MLYSCICAIKSFQNICDIVTYYFKYMINYSIHTNRLYVLLSYIANIYVIFPYIIPLYALLIHFVIFTYTPDRVAQSGKPLPVNTNLGCINTYTSFSTHPTILNEFCIDQEYMYITHFQIYD